MERSLDAHCVAIAQTVLFRGEYAWPFVGASKSQCSRILGETRALIGQKLRKRINVSKQAIEISPRMALRVILLTVVPADKGDGTLLQGGPLMPGLSPVSLAPERVHTVGYDPFINSQNASSN